jgi:3-hydroxyisobutyrate dehydrogenase-like beta-hydroxyacid dehydrogenase
VAELLLDRGVPVRAFAETQDPRAEQLRQLGAKVVAKDLRQIADVESRGEAAR